MQSTYIGCLICYLTGKDQIITDLKRRLSEQDEKLVKAEKEFKQQLEQMSAKITELTVQLSQVNRLSSQQKMIKGITCLQLVRKCVSWSIYLQRRCNKWSQELSPSVVTFVSMLGFGQL